MDKLKIRETLEVAVRATHIRYPQFHGVVLFGSFLTNKPNPSDVDIVPVYERFDTDWDVRRDIIEEYFGPHFVELAKDHGSVIKKHRHSEGLLHVECYVSLEYKIHLRERLDFRKALPQNLIGTDKAVQVFAEVYSSSFKLPVYKNV